MQSSLNQDDAFGKKVVTVSPLIGQSTSFRKPDVEVKMQETGHGGRIWQTMSR